MFPITPWRSVKNLLAVSVVALSVLFTLVAVFNVPPAQADHHEHSQMASAINSSPQQVVQSPARPTSVSDIADVTIVDFAFEPSIITITAGSSVRWTRSPTSNFTHTTTSDVGSTDPWNSGDLAPGQSFTKAFDTPGTYTYHCAHHPTFMMGAVVVLPFEPPAAVSISGPFEGVTNIGYTFTATVSPVTATVPITYFWQATSQLPVTHISSELSDTVMFTWTPETTGTQWVTATATNEAGMAVRTRFIIIDARHVYLPLVLR